ncbi:MAG TPA: hypothetical protein DD670_20015, partial [Planctomycetaceae bacterium]|nr:hypothetical protein [Planctomycetaceae bacterium]
GPRLEIDPACPTEGAGTATEGQAQRIPQKLRGFAPAHAIALWWGECGVPHRLEFKLGNQGFDVVFRTCERSEA